MRDHISRVKILSLFSGLGGAEICFFQSYLAIKKKCVELNLEEPAKPECLIACDVDEFCLKVLQSHMHPPKFLLDNMLRFLKPACSSVHFKLSSLRITLRITYCILCIVQCIAHK